jgi:hypothetical protein
MSLVLRDDLTCCGEGSLASLFSHPIWTESNMLKYVHMPSDDLHCQNSKHFEIKYRWQLQRLL